MESDMIKKMFSNNIKDIKEVLTKGVEINVQNGKYTPLCALSNHGRKDIVKFLIERGADVNSVKILEDGHIRSPLVVCINKQEDEDILEMLLEQGAKPNQAETEHGYTPLTKAIYGRNKESVKILMEYCADVNLKDNEGRLPLEMAIEHEDLGLMQFLLDEGAEFSIQKVFLKAIKTENLEIIQLLIERGARVNLRSISGKTPLTCALEIGNPEIIQLLLDKGADVNLPDASGDAPLTQAIKRGKIKMVELLCENGVDLGRDFPVKTAVDAKNLNILKYLIEMGADFNVFGNNGRTPLTAAIEQHDFGLVHFLLNRGAEINQVDGVQETPFYLAVTKKNVWIAKYLRHREATCVFQTEEFVNQDEDIN